MVIKTKGVVIKQRNIGEKDAIITILTGEYGVIEASARGVKAMKSKLQAGTQPLSFCEFTLFQGKSSYIINDAECLESFYNIRLDVEKFSLASYFCEIIAYAAMPEENASEVTRLLLNTLYVISKSLCEDMFVKAVFEFKFMCISGFSPDLSCCSACGSTELSGGALLLSDGICVCADCEKGCANNSKAQLNDSVIKALRYISENESNKIFSLHIGKNTLGYISGVTEYYLIYHCGHSFKSLDFYKNIKSNM